jgi:ParB/RepB/Spo0J family partition protein
VPVRPLSLLPPDPRAPRLATVPVAAIEADPEQPRTEFDPVRVRVLRDSIAQIGLIEPIVVEEVADGRYRLIAGEYRTRAMRVGLAEQPANPRFQAAAAVVFPAGAMSEPLRRAWQLVENLNRHDLTPGEIARGFRATRAALALQRAEEEARGWDCLPPGYEGAASAAVREAQLRAALAARGLSWPEPSWGEVVAFLGVPLPAGTYARIQRILGLPPPVLERCDALGLTRNAAAALAQVAGEDRQLALLEAARAAGDPSLVTPAAGLLIGEPGMSAGDAVAHVLAARQQAERVRLAQAVRPAAGEHPLPRAVCPPEQFGRLNELLGEATEIVELHRLDAVQQEAARHWLERIGAALGELTCPPDEACQ